MDYEALAKQYGGAVATPAIDYDALARQFGGASVDPMEAVFGKSTSKAEPSRSLIDKARGAIETGAALASGVVSGPIIEGSKIYGALTSGKFGTKEGLRAGEEMGKRVAGQIQYQPRTAAGQEYTAAVANALSETGLQGVPLNVLGELQAGARPAVQAVQDARASQMGQYGARQQQAAARVAEQQSAADWARAPKIEAAQAAQRRNVAINPAEANPNVKTKMLVGATGEAVVNEKASKANMPRWNEMAREDMGLPENTPLDAKAFQKAREAHDAPYEKIRQVPTMVADADALNQLNSLKLDPTLIGNAEKAAKINGVIDDAMNLTAQGLSGKQVVENIRQLRNDASRTMRNQSASPIDLDVADAKLGIANALENIIESNIRDPKALNEFRAARTAMAKTYDWERATGVTTKQVDPAEVVKMAEKGKPLSGALKDIADIAGNYPEATRLATNKEPLLYQRLRRGGAGGTIGFAVGGGPVGAAIGAGLTSLGSEAAANLLTRPGVQNRLAIPADRRIPLPTAPVAEAAPIPRSNALVPFDYSQETFVPPNFVMVDQQSAPRATFVGPEMGTPQLQAPSAERTMAGVAAERQRQYNIDKALYESTAEREAARATGTPMQRAAFNLEKGSTTRGRGSVIEIDPVTGKMTVGAEATTNMTPNIQVIENTAKSLESAARKMAGGMVSETIQGVPQTATRQAQAFALTAEERIAWNKAKTDLAEVMPGFRALDDKVLAERMMDRKWVADALEKSRQKAAMFDDIAKRAADQQAKMEAAAKREQLLDLADILEENLRGGRPVSKGGQGPKTRAHQRNMLSPEQETQNRLIIEISGVGQRK